MNGGIAGECCGGSFFIAATAAAQAPSIVAAQPDETQYYEFHNPHALAPAEDFTRYLLDDWMGFRSTLATRGARVAVLLIADAFGNVSGGVRHGAADYNLTAFGIVLHTDRLLGWSGGQFHVGFAENFGTSLSREYIGNDSPVQLADVADPQSPAHLSVLHVVVVGGSAQYPRRPPDDQQCVERRIPMGLSTSKRLHPSPIGCLSEYSLNAPGAFGYADMTWGARVKFEPVKQFYAMVAGYRRAEVVAGAAASD